MDSTRYQYQPWYIKFWRRRWYLWFYFLAITITIRWILKGMPRNGWISWRGDIFYDSRKFTFKLIWIMAEAHTQKKMNWLYDEEDLDYAIQER